MYIRLEGQTNRLSAEKGYEYANKNQDFFLYSDYRRAEGQGSLYFWKRQLCHRRHPGFYRKSGKVAGRKTSENPLEGIWFSEGGDRLTGAVRTENQGYLITSIPYDENFKITVDGENVEKEKSKYCFSGGKDSGRGT